MVQGNLPEKIRDEWRNNDTNYNIVLQDTANTVWINVPDEFVN